MPLPNEYLVACIKILQRIGLTRSFILMLIFSEFKGSIPFSHLYQHVPPTNPTNDISIYKVEGYNFEVFKSTHIVQFITSTGGCSKYLCKYIAKIDGNIILLF